MMVRMHPVDRDSPVPLWSQVETDLRARIDAGEFVDRFPTDEELVGSYEVSRHTAREAVRRLCADGLVVRERGRGTVLVEKRSERPLDAMYSLFEAVEAGGVEQTSEVLAEVRELSMRESSALATPTSMGATVIQVETLVERLLGRPLVGGRISREAAP